jgi:hypothetical protein
MHFSKIVPFYEIMWKHKVEQDRPQMTVWHMCIACWIPKAIDTHSEYVILIAFTLQQWLNERASILRYTHIAGLFPICLAFSADRSSGRM